MGLRNLQTTHNYNRGLTLARASIKLSFQLLFQMYVSHIKMHSTIRFNIKFVLDSSALLPIL